MNQEYLRIQKMVAEGKVSPEEGTALLESMVESSAKPSKFPENAIRDHNSLSGLSPKDLKYVAVAEKLFLLNFGIAAACIVLGLVEWLYGRGSGILLMAISTFLLFTLVEKRKLCKIIRRIEEHLSAKQAG